MQHTYFTPQEVAGQGTKRFKCPIHGGSKRSVAVGYIDVRRDKPLVETGVAIPLPPELAPAVEMARLQERNKALEELADYHRQLLSDSEWRFQEMIHQLKQSNDTIATLSRALPEPKDESDDTASPAAAAPAEKKQRRPRWWPFGRK